MFGHERGAFTGATERRLGRFELAHEGTLFLDEIGDLSAEAQAKLLRTLETGELQRLGAESSQRVDVRIVAATNRRLEDAVADGDFREDLFFRLNVFPIRLPPLRERLEDLPALVTHLAERVRPRQARDLHARRRSTRCAGYAWPGNVRELANLVERLSILVRPTVDAGAVRAGAARRLRRRRPTAALGRPLSEALDDYERGLLRAALTQAEGNIAEAARVLRTDRANLYRRMRRLGPRPATKARPRPLRHSSSACDSSPAACCSCSRCPPLAPGPGQRDRHRPRPAARRTRRRAGRARRPTSWPSCSRSTTTSATTRVQGDVSFPAGSGSPAGWRSSAARSGSRDGSAGDVVVVNATLYLLPGADVEGDVLVVGGRLIRSPGARHVGRERVLVGRGTGAARTPDGVLVLRERRRPLGELATARASFQTGRVRTDAAARHRRHLQPDRGAADRLRPDLRAPARQRGRSPGWTCAASSARRARGPG